MGNWGAENFHQNNSKTLEGIIAEFPSGLKQAMFAAASTRVIKRMTWNGCALNAAGMEIGRNDSVKSLEKAAETFGITKAQAGIFIRNWDTLEGTDEEATQHLRFLLEKVGLFSEPGQRPPKFVVRKKVYENQQKKLREEFDSLMEANEVPDVDLALDILVGV
jgi:hypothetical protein